MNIFIKKKITISMEELHMEKIKIATWNISCGIPAEWNISNGIKKEKDYKNLVY